MNCGESLDSRPLVNGPRTVDHDHAPITNMDPETGIRYGVICCNDVDQDFIEEVYLHLDYQVKEELYPYGIKEEAIDEIIEGLELEVESEGMVVMIDSSNDLWIFKSPEIGRRGLCSPCAPGACHLKTPGDYECYILPEELMNA